MVLICASHMANDVEYLFVCLVVSHIFFFGAVLTSSVKCLFRFFAHFLKNYFNLIYLFIAHFN